MRRTQRTLYGMFPRFWHARLIDKAARTPFKAHLLPVQSLARSRLQQELTVSTGWQALDDSTIALEIHGKSRHLSLDEPCQPVSPGVSYLWQMSSSYMGYLLVADEQDRHSQLVQLVRLCNGYMELGAWQIPGVFSQQWHPYAASHRVLNLVCARALYDENLCIQQKAQLDRAIQAHALYIDANLEYDIHLNHLAKNVLALVVCAAYCSGNVPVTLFSQYRRVVDYQLFADGGHVELCPMYHLQVLADLLLLDALPNSLLLPDDVTWLQLTIERMRTAAGVMSFSDGEVALFGDSWHGECPSAADLGVPSSIPSSVGSTDAITRTRSLSPDGLGWYFLQDTGYIKCQTGSLELIMDVGHAGAPENPGHAHDDYLSVEMTVAGQRWIVDYGVSSYAAGESRENTRSAQNHNGPTYNHAKGLDAWGSFRVGARRGAPVVSRRNLAAGWRAVDAVHKPLGKMSISLKRTLFVNPGVGLAICDSWIGVSRSQEPRSAFYVTRDTSILAQHGYQMQVSNGIVSEHSDACIHRTIGVAVKARKMVLQPSTDFVMLLFVHGSADIDSISSFLIQASRQ